MKKPLLTVLRQSTKLLNSIIFFTCWSQLHAHANSLFLNKGENVTPVMEVSSSVREKILDAKTEKSKKTAELHDTKSEKRVRFNKINSPTAHISQGMKTINTKVYSNERYYLSDIKEGIIGTDADHPIDQVYDNIFNVSLNEKINSAYQYTLEYDLYGASSYKQVSKVINDELAIGGNNLQKSEGWIHQSEPISVNSIKEGINTIIFTIPDQSKYSYKIRNLQIGVFKKKHNFEVLNEKHNAATISKFIASISDAEKINLESAELAIPKGTLKSSENFSITALRDIDMPVLSPEMVNVTSKNSGYRFLPHGEHFSAPAKVSIGYDRSKIPAGYTEQDIRTYYFNKSEKKWIALEKDSLNSPQNILVSKTTHFTDMVNGILKVPESPETGSYAPNSIKDIKAANPSEGIVSIAPPSANNMGSVATSFPIKLPAGRAGMQPSLSVNYNSEGGNGWMGMGWDLSIPAVTIDTRWGVPTYNSGVETEIYTLGGEQLTFETSPGVFVMPNRTEGFEKARQSDTLFYPRIEGAYNKILRKGTNPKDYVWIVTSKDGTKSYFGGDENGVNENTVLRVKNTNDANANDNIGYWALYKTVDTHGNYVLYTYHKFDYTTNDTQAIGNKGQEMYINKIEYALTSVANPSLKKYTVNFAYDTEQREDVQVNARLGFVQVTSKRLGNIQVLYDNAPVRSYEFKYKKGGFSKSLLESITEKDASGAEFYTNKIEYFETPSSLFGEPQVWKVDNPVTGNGAEYFSDTFTATIMPGVNEIFGGKYSALNSSSSTSKSSSFRLGFWKYSTANTRPTPIVIMPSLLPIFIVGVITEMGRFSIGAAGGFGSSESQTQVSLVDVDGDNLSDIIYKIGNEYYYAKNKNGHFELNNNQKLNIPGVGYSKSRSWNVGLDGNYAVGTGISTGLGFDYSNTTTDSKIYFEDFNSDGLVDVSNNGKVLFSSNPNASTSPNDFVPNFDPNSMLSPAPIKILSQNISVATPSFNASEKKNMLEQNPLHDVVRVWVAPKAGNIKITNQYQQPPQAYPANEDVTGVDGVAVSVQKNNENPIAASIKSINKDDNTVYTNSLDVSVNQGDKIYFRVSSKYDGRYDQINWNPSIEYTGAASQLDSDGRDINIYDSQKDFVVSDKSLYYIPSVNGQTTNISATIYVNGLKPVTSDQIFINIYKNNVIVNTSKLDWNDNAPVNISFPTILNTSDNLTVKIETDSQIDWAALDLNATINYANGTSDTVPIEFGMYNDRTNTYTQYTVMAADVNNLVITKIPTLPTANFTGNMSITAKYPNQLLTKIKLERTKPTTAYVNKLTYSMPYLITNADIGKKIYLEGSIDSKTLGFINAVNNLNGTLIKTTKNFINDPTTVTYTTTYTTVDKKGYIAVGQATGSLTFKFASTPAGTLSASVKIYNSITNTLVTTLTISNTAITTTYPSLPRGVYKYEITYTGTIAAPPSTVLTINTGGTESTTATATVVNKHKKLLFNDITKTLAQLGIQYDARLGDLYRGWGSFIVNGNNIQNTSITRSHVINSATDLANNASATEMKIDETKLFINSSGSSYDGSSTINNPTIDPGTGLPSPYSPSPSAMSNQYFVLMNHISGNKDTGKPKSWLGLDEQNYITKDIISVSRLGEDDIDATFSSQTPTFVSGSYQLPSLIQKSKLNSVSVKGGVSASFSGLSGDGNFSKTIFAENKAVTAVADFNGDGFPDHIVDSNIQFTNPNGFLSSKNANIGSYSISRTDDALGLGAGTNFTHGSASYSLSRNTQFPNTFSQSQKTVESSVSLSGNYGYEKEKIKKTYFDINGDGVADRIEGKKVELGLGYTFYNQIPADITFNPSYSTNKNYGGGIGLSLFNGSIQGGASLSGDTNDINEEMFDLNGDGLLDYVNLDSSADNLNLGNKFVNLMSLSVNQARSTTTGSGTNFGSSYPIPIPIVTNPTTSEVSVGLKIVPGITNRSSKNVSKTKSTFRDMNGDGFPDYVSSDDANTITVRLNQIGTTNFLKKVTTPMGGSWEVTYERQGNTYDMPQNKYVLKSVTTNDGFTGDDTFSPDVSKVTIDYKNPYHSRLERTFYGFESITVNQIDTKQGGVSSNSIYRKTIQRFDNKNYYLKGALLDETLLDAQNKLWTLKENNYELRAIKNTNSGFAHKERENEKNYQNYACFVVLTDTNSNFYEGGTGNKYTFTNFETYDEWGNATKVLNYGDPDIGTTEELTSIVKYENQSPTDYIIMPVSVKNTASGVIREKKAMYNPTTGDLTKMTVVNQGIDYSVYEFEYDDYGNITKSTGPANYANQRFFHQYTYDDNVKTYPVKVQDAFGYTSKTQYDYRFGLPTLTEDMNLQPMKYVYDAKARTTEIVGPYEMFNNIPWTIKFEYNPITNAPQNAANAQSYATTKHYDPEYADSTINTITIADGFGEAIQVKKTGYIHNDGLKYIVAGKVETDAFGRALKTYYPTIENIGSSNTLYNAAVDNIAPTINQYDVLDRATYTRLPGENLFSTITYGFGTDVQGRRMFETIFKDELGSVKKTYTDMKGRTTSVHEVSNTGDIKTQFMHDAIGEILQVKDVQGNITISVYDGLGRRVSYQHPDSGITTYAYDRAGNMTSKTNSANEVVHYEYDYTRLKAVNYPVYPENNVKYYYGNALDASAMDNNAVGRLWYQTDATGTQYLKYGRLGELTYQRRSVAVPDAGVYWFGTEWQYDTWNRVKSITYPDGEIVKYGYNRAGNLINVSSDKDGIKYKMINNIGYDKFEQRVYLANGNGTETTYEYETNRRRLLKMYAKNSTRSFMENTYQYDVVSNVMQIHNNAPVTTGLLGGGTNYAYGYDDLYRLTSASGNWRGINTQAQEERHRYSVTMTYDNMHNVMSKTQKHEWTTGAANNNWAALEPTSYRLNYKYEDPAHPHAPTRIIDEPNLVPTATCCNPDDPGVKFQDYTYDAKGNPTKIDQETCNHSEEKTRYLWDEENRLRFVDTNPSTIWQSDGAAIYTYDAGGERIIKDILIGGIVDWTSGNGSGTFPNFYAPIHISTIYPNGLITLDFAYGDYVTSSTTRYTKHYYAGSQRIASKIGTSNNIGMFNCNWLIIPFGGVTPPINPVTVSNNILQTATQSNLNVMQNNNITPPPSYGQNAGYNGNCANSYAGVKEQQMYWFHPDHLGSSSYITGVDGEVTQNIEYFPSGEVFVENHRNSNYSPYKFNGKELDAETGYYYYGARYYNPRVSLWLNVDPLAEQMPNWSPYVYAFNSPVRFIDPDGRWPWDWVNGAGVLNNIFKSGARNKAELAAARKNRQTGFYGTGVSKGAKGTWEVSYSTSRFTYWDTYNAKGLVSSIGFGSDEGGGYGAIAPGTTAVDSWGPTIGSVPESRGKTDIQMQVSENPLVQGAAMGLLVGGIGNVIRNASQPTNYVYRALTNANAESLAAGEGIYGKAVNGTWSLEEHLIRGSSPKSFLNDPWISTTTDINVAKSFSSGNGIVRINLSKMAPGAVIKNGGMVLPRSSAGYHYSIWQQEVSILGRVPQNAIKVIK